MMFILELRSTGWLLDNTIRKNKYIVHGFSNTSRAKVIVGNRKMGIISLGTGCSLYAVWLSRGGGRIREFYCAYM